MFKLLADSHSSFVSHTSAGSTPTRTAVAGKLHSIVYVSTAVDKFSEKSLSILVEKASLRNTSLGVTGLLLYSDGNFMQCLEGSKESIDILMQSIHSDHRHFGLFVLLEDEISNREFAEWGMAVRSPDAGLTTMACSQSIDFWLNTRIEEQKKSLSRILLENFWLQRRNKELEVAVKDLEAFSYSVCHDLRSPLNTIDGFGMLLQKTSGAQLNEKSSHYLNRMRAGVVQMGALIDDMFSLAKLGREPLRVLQVNLQSIAQGLERECRDRDPEREVEVDIQEGFQAIGDPTLLLIVMQNLFENAWKYTSKLPAAKIVVGSKPGACGETIYFVSDNGAGFDMAFADKLFTIFQRLHSPSDFSGAGIGLANVKRVIDRHGGHIWAESAVGEGSTFYFTLALSENNQVQ